MEQVVELNWQRSRNGTGKGHGTELAKVVEEQELPGMADR
jgi:hypothetical protein